MGQNPREEPRALHFGLVFPVKLDSENKKK